MSYLLDTNVISELRREVELIWCSDQPSAAVLDEWQEQVVAEHAERILR